MSTVWAICGAGRGLGKTHLAQRLCAVLPGAVYVKCGHGRAQPGKPSAFVTTEQELEAFLAGNAPSHDHVIIESNAFALTGRAQVVIYLEGTPAGAERREDADLLRALADVVLGDRAGEAHWRQRLEARLGSGPALPAVLDVLQAQGRYLECREWAGDAPAEVGWGRNDEEESP